MGLVTAATLNTKPTEIELIWLPKLPIIKKLQRLKIKYLIPSILLLLLYLID